MWLWLATDGVENGAGKSFGVILRNVPGFSVATVAKAAEPVNVFAGSSAGGQASATEIPVPSAATVRSRKKAGFRDVRFMASLSLRSPYRLCAPWWHCTAVGLRKESPRALRRRGGRRLDAGSELL